MDCAREENVSLGKKERRLRFGAGHSEGEEQRQALSRRRQLGMPLSVATSQPSLSCLQLHTSELDDGMDWSKLNLRSVTEESQLEEFLRTAELAGTEFTAGLPASTPFQ